ncbi:MAG: phosphoenolpyruvate--protein phosphotransferase [Planctomycetota bacterium]|jgi:phosphotransferase system enzyme I (PtsI)
MRTFQGIPVSPGVTIAPAFLRRSVEAMPPRFSVSKARIPVEIERFGQAVEQARVELDQIASRAGLADAVTSIAAGHREFLKDPTLLGEVESAIRNGRSTAAYAVAVVFRRWIEKFKALEDDFFRQRYVDLLDIEHRVLRHLQAAEPQEKPTPDHPAVLVTHDLTPSEAAGLDRRSFLGFATELGGATSHTAIIAKSLGIPAVCGLGAVAEYLHSGDTVICDGESGLLIVDPDDETLKRYRRLRDRLQRRWRILKRMAELPAETPDGWPVGVYGNIEFPFEVQQTVENGADGIGLYRTEFLYADTHSFPDEEAHLAAYREALDQLKGRPLIIRTFDFGADKFAEELGMAAEPNPFLGCRSVRYSFARPELFRTQLRAILRASKEGRISLMFPMISSVTEMRQARSILDQVMEELRRDGVEFDTNIKVGCMVEIPSAAVAADLLADEVDFFSLGSNDLTQYTLAVDRTNERVANLFQPANPAIVRLLRLVVSEGERRGIRVAMCGEMAAERPFTLLLLGLGIRYFSVAPGAVPEVKRVVRSIPMRRAAQLIQKVMALATPEEVHAFLSEQADKLLADH